MGTRTVWVECRLGENEYPCFFPGHNLQHARARALKFFGSLSIPEDDLIIKEYIPRRKIVTPRKRRKLLARKVLFGK